MGSSSSEVLYVSHHDVKQILQPITSFLMTALNPKCTALQFTYLTSPFFPCLQVQIAQRIFRANFNRHSFVGTFSMHKFNVFKAERMSTEDW
jgi:hypothetical protein